MAWTRGDVVLIPFPFSDLNASKTRPTVIVSVPEFQAIHGELLLAYLTSNVAQPHPTLDYILADWQATGLLKPTVMKPRLAVVHESLVKFKIGTLSQRDLEKVDECLRRALGL
ncbi:MAG: type II toxin-antitoxin system PemK/MazF family toxin [Chloroflexi bacterium]|nr:type II toxin-antitoxin system PemK/MazF family toxin [Chloroflexota bacterium]